MTKKKKIVIAVIAVLLALIIALVSVWFAFFRGDKDTGNGKKPSSNTTDIVDDKDDESDQDTDGIIDEILDSIKDILFPDDNEEKEREIIKTSDLNGKVYCTDFKTADTVYYITVDGLDTATVDMLMSLQGIVAKTESQIYLKKSDDEKAFEELQTVYGINMVRETDPWALVDRFKSYLSDNGFVRYIVYDESENYFLTPYAPTSVNVAAVIAGQENYLMVDESLIETAKAHGLTEKANALDYDEFMIFTEYMDSVNQNVFASISKTNHALYDVAIAMGCMIHRGTDMEWMLSKLEPDGVVMGWYDNESLGVKAASTQGYTTLALDNARNFTVYAGLEHKKLEQKNSIKYEQEDNKDVHYVTFIMSDGDNLCYDYNMVSRDIYYGTESHGEIPFGWSLSPNTYEWLPNIVENLYTNMSYHDNFVASVSGYGYMFPNIYPTEYLEAFAKRSAEYMKMNDMSYITLASSNENSSALDDYVPYFSQYDQILGGHFNDMSSKSECYVHREYGGGVVWYNDKPFIYDRESFATDWEITADRGLTKSEAISQMAYRINNIYKRDINSIEGYTIINVNPWFVSYEDCITLAEEFNEDVIVVTPSELFELVAKNVPHKDYLDMEGKNLCGEFDYSSMTESVDTHFVMKDTFERMTASETLTYSFAGGEGTKGWKIKAGPSTEDRAYYDGSSVYLRGYKTGGSNTAADNQIYNKLKLPSNVGTIKFKTSGNAAVRLLVMTDDGTLYTVKDWEKLTSSAYTDISFDISKFKGKTVTFMYQMQDSTGGSATCKISSVTIS